MEQIELTDNDFLLNSTIHFTMDPNNKCTSCDNVNFELYAKSDEKIWCKDCFDMQVTGEIHDISTLRYCDAVHDFSSKTLDGSNGVDYKFHKIASKFLDGSYKLSVKCDNCQEIVTMLPVYAPTADTDVCIKCYNEMSATR